MPTLLLTGGNRGIGLEAAAKFADTHFTRIILTVRSADKGPDAVSAASAKSGKPVFQFQVLDLSSTDSVRAAVDQLPPLDAVVLNAGGLGSENLTEQGVTENFAMNVLGNVILVEGLLENKKINANARIIYSHSETTRSVWGFAGFQPYVRIEKETMEKSMAQPPTRGTLWLGVRQRMNTYANSKLIGGLWLSKLAKEYPQFYFASVSPGGCADTQVYDDAPQPMRCLMKLSAVKWAMEGLGLCHPVEAAAKRYVTAVTEPDFETRFPSGSVVGGPFMKICAGGGQLVDQANFASYYTDAELQDEAARIVRAKAKE